MSNGSKLPLSQPSEKKTNDKFPNWDILPPFQFINPRVRTTEPTQETKAKQESQSTNPIFNPETTSSTVQVLTKSMTNPPDAEAFENCPACGTANKPEAQYCRECGLRLSEPQPSDATSPRTIKCPHCGEELELDSSDEGIGEYNCPECGKDFELS